MTVFFTWLLSTLNIAKWRCVTVAVCVTSDAAATVAICLYQSYLNVLFLFSAHIKDAVETDCTKCSDRQKKGAEKVLVFLHKNKPDKYKALEDKYDPGRTYYKSHETLFKGSK